MSEHYDHIVENLYLTAMNSREIYGRLLHILKKSLEMETEPSSSIYRIPLSKARVEAGLKGVITDEQYFEAWSRCKRDLMEQAYHELSLENPKWFFNSVAKDVAKGQQILEETQEKYEQQLQSTYEANIMSQLQNTPVKTITYVYGRNVDDMTKQDLIDAIKRTKKEIADLDAAGVESKFITQQKAELQTAIDLMVEKLDADVQAQG